jgi:exodeoxyribonuclease VII large subunit
MLEQRKRLLASEGLFDESRKKPLPIFPKTVGVVTSSTGAALRDIMQIIRRRNPTTGITIFPAIVQGSDAAASIAKQIEVANRFNMCDVLIVGRGGGSLEDLLPFSEEIVVRAVSNSKIPVISAVGHEIDWALCDFAADKRAPTPSAAAELCTPVKTEVIAYLQNKQNDFYTAIKSRVENLKLMVKQFSPENMEARFRSIEQPLLYRFDVAKEELLNKMSERLKDTRIYIEKMKNILEASNPSLILEKGFSMVRDKTTGKIIRGIEDTNIGAEIEIIPAKGKISATVIDGEK